MPPEKTQQFDTHHLLDDINHVNQVNKIEIKKMNMRIRQSIAEANLQGSVATSIIEEVSIQLGQLSTKVKLTEKALHSLRLEKKYKFSAAATKNEKSTKKTDLKFNANQLAGNRNLLPLESSSNGVRYVWSGSDPKIQFTFSLDRSKTIGMQIWLFALIKPEYSKQLKVLIDGEPVKHRFRLDGGLFVLSCNLPPSTKTGQTAITIVLPATHSPIDVGSSNDKRKLGIAFHEIRFGKPESGFSHLFKRLKSRS